MKKIILQEFGSEDKPNQEIELTKEQADLVDKHGWPDALHLKEKIGACPAPETTGPLYPVWIEFIYTLEDWNGDTATYTKVNHPLFVCQPAA